MYARVSTVAIVRLYSSMVGHKFIEALKEKDPSNKFNVVTFCEENRAAYNRMRLTEVCMYMYVYVHVEGHQWYGLLVVHSHVRLTEVLFLSVLLFLNIHCSFATCLPTCNM